MNAFDLDERVDAYESALLAGKAGVDNLEEFLPETANRQAALVELLRVTLEHQWQPGREDALASLRSRFPEVFANKQCLTPLAYEEYRLRAGDGQQVDKQEYAQRYGIDVSPWPSLATDFGSQFDENAASWTEFSLSNPASASRLAVTRRQMPHVGERFGPFELLAVLGQGAFGKVFLAKQTSLADRRVALKVFPGTPLEADKLARMQHTNIVPVYSVHRRGRLSGVCMPFLGGVTLADLITSLRKQAKYPHSTDSLVSTVEARQAELSTILDSPTAHEASSEARHAPPVQAALLRWANFRLEDAVVWIMARVAGGLAHAHQRGILHRDLKPANILISDDGEPLILDFNLSAEAEKPDGHVARLGGTLPYMAPEHLAQLQNGGPMDARSDIFALGVVLYESLTCQQPFPIRRGALEDVLSQMIRDRRQSAPASVRKLNPAVSPGLEAIVSKCLEADPTRRYASAAQLQTDLKRHLDNRPLRYTPELSLRERAQKWTRRHPRLSSATTVALLAGCLAAVAGGLWSVREQKLSQKVAEDQLRAFTTDAPEARSLLSLQLLDPALEARGLEAALAALQPYQVLEDAKWHERKQVRNLTEVGRLRLASEVTELLTLLARQKTSYALPDAETLRMRAREGWQSLTGMAAPTLNAGEVVSALPANQADAKKQQVAEALELLLTATSQMQLGKLAEAQPIIERLVALHPHDVAAWLLLGNCYAEQGDLTSAEAAYTACIALRDDLYLGFHYRGLARLQAKRWERAIEDFSLVQSLRPSYPAAAYNRGIARQSQGDHQGAVEDITLALRNGLLETRAYFSRAQSWKALGNQEAAEGDRQEGIRRKPNDLLSWIERGLARMEDDPQGAEQDLLEAARIGRHSRWARVALMNLAHVQSERLGKHAAAIEQLDELLELQPDDAVARGSRAVLAARLGKEAEALTDLKELGAHHQESFSLYQAACVHAILAKQGHADLRASALQLLSQALAGDPKLKATAVTDPDLDGLQTDPIWEKLLGNSHASIEDTPASSALDTPDRTTE